MKQILIVFSVVLVGMTGCDIVTEPYGPVIDYGWDPAYDQSPVYNDTNAVPRRRILLEEFTGHKCPNCPEGQRIADDLLVNNPEDMVVVSIHAGSFAEVDLSNPDKPFPDNYTTETGDRLMVAYKVGTFPNGLLNRSTIDGNELVFYKQWEAKVNELLADSSYIKPRFKFNLMSTFNNEPGNKTVRVQYKVECVSDEPGNIAIVGYLLESKIISPQIDSQLPPGQTYVEDYEHNHMLRVGFPGHGSGRTIFSNPVVGDISEVTDPSDYLITGVDDSWVAENMYVVIFAYNSETGEVLGTEEIHLVN